jgi:predicted transposase/invertase (TIGR01784 family)
LNQQCPVFFAEVQWQKDEKLYERLFGDSFLYFYRNRNYCSDWQAVVIYPSRSVEQSDVHPDRALLNSEQLHRVYLDELGDIAQLPLGVALMVLTTLSEALAPAAARLLLARVQGETASAAVKQGIMDMIGTIMVYRFTKLSRQEIDAMLGTNLEETRVYREARADDERSLVLAQLTDQVGALPATVKAQVDRLEAEQLTLLGHALLRFSKLEDLTDWLAIER